MLGKLLVGCRFVLYKFKGSVADNQRDYDAVSNTYDTFYTTVMGKYSIGLIEKLNLKSSDRVLELACGTGFISEQLGAKLHDSGSLVIVERSAGMLSYAKERLKQFKTLNLTVYEDDMMEVIKKLPANSFDKIICGWAICYVNHTKFMTELYRILKVNGEIGIIDSRDDSEKVLMDAFERIVTKKPRYIQKYVELSLMPNAKYLQQLFRKCKFSKPECYEGEQPVPHKSIDDVLNWLLKSGVSAGFMDVLDRKYEAEIIEKMREEIAVDYKKGNYHLTHTYVAGTAVKTE